MAQERSERANGPAFAGVVAAGLAFATLGLTTTLAEVFDGFGDWLSFSNRTGMLAGETVLAACVYLLSWAGLALLWRRSNPPLKLMLGITALLILAGLVGTFPPFFRIFGVEE